MSDTTARLMALLDEATDPGWIEGYADLQPDDPIRIALNGERQAAALAALALLALRGDDSMAQAWEAY